MEKRKRLSTILMLATMGVLLIYGLVSWKEGADSEALRRFTSSPNKMLLDHVEKAYFPGFSYAAKNRRFSAGEWVAEQAMHMIPLGSYVAEKEDTGTDIEDKETYEMILAKQAADENAVDENGNLIGGEEEQEAVETSGTSIDTSLEKLKNYEYLLGNFYTVDSTTMTSPEELDAEALLAKDMKIDTSTKEPKVLIYHTHSQEGFVDSVEGDDSTTIMGMGTYLTELLNERGIPTIHHEGVYDLIDGNLDRSKAYDLAEPQVRKILEDNPSIEVLIDLHRDGVAEGTHLVTEANGKQTAQIMFFNGLSRTKANGDIAYLYNPYIQDNLAFSLQMQLKAMELHPGFTRHTA